MLVAVVILALGLFGAAALLRRRSAFRFLFAALAVLAAALAVWRDAFYWPVLPALLVVAVSAVLLLSHRLEHIRRGWLVLGVLLAWALCLGSAAMVAVLPMFSLPAPTGPYAVGTRTEDWTDPATGRELVVQIWYPALAGGTHARYARLHDAKPMFAYWHSIRANAWQDAPVAASTQPFPLLLFGHMWGGRRTQDTALAEDLASHGYVVASPDHPGNAARVQLHDGSVVKSDRAKALNDVETTGVQGIHAVWTRELQVWTADNEFVLGALAAGRAPWLAGRLDLSRVGAFGHSFGGAASMALLGLPPSDGAPPVRAAVNLDGWTFDGLDHRTTEPAMFVYEARDEGMAGGLPTGASADDQLERADQMNVRRSLASGGGFRAYMLGTQHADFTDAVLLSPLERLTYTGPIKPARAVQITRTLVLGFFDQTLRGAGGIPAFPEVKVEANGAGPH